MALPARTSRLTDAVFAAFGETATLYPAAGGETVTVRAKLRRPSGAEQLWQAETVVASPVIEIPYVDYPSLRRHDIVDGLDDRRWKITDAPTRPGDGRKWVAVVLDAGPAT